MAVVSENRDCSIYNARAGSHGKGRRWQARGLEMGELTIATVHDCAHHAVDGTHP